MKLYSYCLRYDDGAAPNPYHKLCTLAICKPRIRSVAKVDDWIVGLGSKHSCLGDISESVVYAMKITDVLTFEEYDKYCLSSLPEKLPDWRSQVFQKKIGDCIYDYGRGNPPTIRESVHTEGNRKSDLDGKNVLLSNHFYYFGDKPIKLADHLMPIVHRTQGHKSHANDDYVDKFVDWIETLGYSVNDLQGEPQLKSYIVNSDPAECRTHCSNNDMIENTEDGWC